MEVWKSIQNLIIVNNNSDSMKILCAKSRCIQINRNNQEKELLLLSSLNSLSCDISCGII